MINVVYLVLVITTGNTGIATYSIPQANMAQCQVNAKNYSNKKYGEIDYHKIVAHCIVGVK